MSNYIEVLKIAFVSFPFIALIISAPFILIQYHKYGSISLRKALIIYSFTLYMICAYYLVILPLPKLSDVAKLTTPRMQLIPLSFIFDLIKNINRSTILVPLFNIFLTIPFGIYLRYFFKCDIKKTIKYTFLLTLFYELTQLSGLYFIYKRGYRLFDVDDLLLNTLGGIIGYYIAKPFIKRLPTVEEINEDAKIEGQKISGFKRSTTFILDIFIYALLSTILYINVQFKHYLEITLIMYYILIPIVNNQSTIAEKYLNIKIVDYKEKNNIIRLIFRRLIFILIYLGIPFIFAKIVRGNLAIIIFVFIIFYIYVVSFIKYLFTNKPMLYERISKTKQISTIKERKNDKTN